jgi:hypothetical protein
MMRGVVDRRNRRLFFLLGSELVLLVPVVARVLGVAEVIVGFLVVVEREGVFVVVLLLVVVVLLFDIVVVGVVLVVDFSRRVPRFGQNVVTWMVVD